MAVRPIPAARILHKQISAVCPIVSASLSRIDFAPEATEKQKSDAEAIRLSFDSSADYRSDDEKVLAGIRIKVLRGEDITASEVKFAVIQWLKGKA